jgi:acyl-CoA thioester hydrolase
MARVKIDIPAQKPLFTTIVPVRITDINYGGHMGNDALLSMLHEARMRMLTAAGHSELNAAGNSLIMADVMISYRNEAFFADPLTIDIYATEVTSRSFDLVYHAFIAGTDARKDIAIAKTGMVCFDYDTRKIAPMTDALKTWLGAA